MIYTKLFRNIYLQSCILLTMSLIFTPISDSQRVRGRPRLCATVTIPNAIVRHRHNYKIMRISCLQGFTIQGSNLVACENGKWNAATPVCAKEGCKKPKSPPNGLVLPGRFTAHLHCKEGYRLAGGRVTYCNGTSWDRPLGECRETNNTHQLTCDFETEDLCGWSHDETDRFDWKRVMAGNMFQTLQTGPQHDHTTLTNNSGHYMLLESFDQRPESVARLLSPIYPKNITQNSFCFKFYYFMYGATVGSLSVYVRPVSVDIDQMLREPKYRYFSLSGNQNSVWNEALFIVEEMLEDFQIVVQGTAGSNHLSDIAIDDVELMISSKCNTESTTLMPLQSTSTEKAIYDIQSCEGRCSETNSTENGITNIKGRYIKLCDCHSECESIETCCPNYRTVCEFGYTESSTDLYSFDTIIPKDALLVSTALIPTTFLTNTPEVFNVPTYRTNTSTESTKTTFTTKRNYTLETTTLSPIKTTVATVSKSTVKKAISTGATTTPVVLSPLDTFTPTVNRANTDILITEKLSTLSTKSTISPENHHYTSENTLQRRREEIITWNVSHSSQMEIVISTLDVASVVFCSITLFFLIFIVLRRHGNIRKKLLGVYGNSSGDYSETTTLTYNRSEDIIIED